MGIAAKGIAETRQLGDVYPWSGDRHRIQIPTRSTDALRRKRAARREIADLKNIFK